ncbi:MAG: MFS transporter [Cucumibacter sp.]
MRFGLDLPPQMRVYGAFFVYSLGLGGLYSRLGDIQLAMGVEEGALGAALIGGGIGTFISLTFASPLLERIGFRPTLTAGIVSLSGLIALASFSVSPLMLFAILLFNGLAIGAIEVVINVEADRTEHAIGRRVMNRSHAFWSFGFFLAGLIGAGAKQAGLSPQLHLMLIVPLVVVATILLLGRFSPAAARTSKAAERRPKFAAPTLGIMILVTFTLSSMLLEGAGADWSVIYMRDVFNALPFVNGLAFAAGALAQALARYFADGYVERYGPLAIARGSVGLMMAGGLLVTFAPHPAIALFGFALVGAGTSTIFPLAMSAAAQRSDRAAAINVAALAQMSFVAFLVGPPLLGFVAEHFGVRMSFALCLPLVVVSWFAARALLRPPLMQAQPGHA